MHNPFGKKLDLEKLGHRAATATKAAVKGAAHSAATVVAQRAGGVNENMKAAHERLTSLHSSYSELHSALKHQALNAKKTAKIVRESNTPMLNLANTLGPEPRRTVQTAMSVDAALARCWEDYATHLEAEVITPAKHECNALFTEGEHIWSSYVGTVNELAARQGKERLLGGKTAQAIVELTERKATHEATKLPRLAALAAAAEAAMAFLVEEHRLLHAALHRDAHSAASSAAGDAASMQETAALLVAARAGWQALREHSGSGAFLSHGSSGGFVGTPPPSRSVFGTALESLSLRRTLALSLELKPARDLVRAALPRPPRNACSRRLSYMCAACAAADAVDGVPLVAHHLIHRLISGSMASGVAFIETEGLFRVQVRASPISPISPHISHPHLPHLPASPAPLLCSDVLPLPHLLLSAGRHRRGRLTATPARQRQRAGAARDPRHVRSSCARHSAQAGHTAAISPSPSSRGLL